MSQHRKGAILMLIVAGICLALDELAGVPTGFMAAFVVGLGGGLLIGEEMSQDETAGTTI